jgi:hypothetical protein
MGHGTQVLELGEGVTQAVCTCGWRSDRYGQDKQVGTMDALQRPAMPPTCTSGTPRCPESYSCRRFRSRSARAHGAETNLVERADSAVAEAGPCCGTHPAADIQVPRQP